MEYTFDLLAKSLGTLCFGFLSTANLLCSPKMAFSVLIFLPTYRRSQGHVTKYTKNWEEQLKKVSNWVGVTIPFKTVLPVCQMFTGETFSFATLVLYILIRILNTLLGCILGLGRTRTFVF